MYVHTSYLFELNRPRLVCYNLYKCFSEMARGRFLFLCIVFARDHVLNLDLTLFGQNNHEFLFHQFVLFVGTVSRTEGSGLTGGHFAKVICETILP